MNYATHLDPADIAHRALVPVGNGDRLRALVVDDNVIDRRRLKSMCDEAELSLNFTDAGSIADMEAALAEQVFDVIFIDYRLDDGDGLGALTIIKKNNRNHNTATIMVAGIAHAAVAVSALKSGCNDYILKDALDSNWLRRAVVNALEKARMQQEIDVSEDMRALLTMVLKRFSAECTQEMKPVLSQMLRRIRSLRTAPHTASTGQPSNDIDALISSCEQLWQFFEGFERAAIDTCDRQLPKNRAI